MYQHNGVIKLELLDCGVRDRGWEELSKYMKVCLLDFIVYSV